MKKSAVFAIALFAACGTQIQPAAESDTSAETQIPHFTLVPVDTIGIELGESNLGNDGGVPGGSTDSNYVFGAVDAALFGENGEIIVLDGSKKQISVFSPDGEFIKTIGRQGSGPGEFQRPVAMALLGNGQLAVSDPWAGKISLFDSSHVYTGAITGFFPAPPMAITGADGEAIIGLMKKLDVENDLIGYSLARLDGTAEPSFIYAREMMPFEPTMIGPGYTETTVAFASDQSGRVFTSIMSSDNYQIEGFLPDGERFVEIEKSYEMIAKTPEEIQNEIDDFSTFLENRATSGGGGRMQSMGVQIPADELNYEPNPYHYAVSALMIDNHDQLWARRGSEQMPFFDVYDFNGNLLFTASVEEDDLDAEDWVLAAGDDRCLAFSPDPLGYPRVVVLSLQ